MKSADLADFYFFYDIIIKVRRFIWIILKKLGIALMQLNTI